MWSSSFGCTRWRKIFNQGWKGWKYFFPRFVTILLLLIDSGRCGIIFLAPFKLYSSDLISTTKSPKYPNKDVFGFYKFIYLFSIFLRIKMSICFYLFIVYGMTEALMVALTATKQLRNVKTRGSVGKPIPNTRMKIVMLDNPKGLYFKIYRVFLNFYAYLHRCNVEVKVKIQ